MPKGRPPLHPPELLLATSTDQAQEHALPASPWGQQAACLPGGSGSQRLPETTTNRAHEPRTRRHASRTSCSRPAVCPRSPGRQNAGPVSAPFHPCLPPSIPVCLRCTLTPRSQAQRPVQHGTGTPPRAAAASAHARTYISGSHMLSTHACILITLFCLSPSLPFLSCA